MDERESNPNNVVVLTPMIVHEYFEKHTKMKDNSITNRDRRMIRRERNRRIHNIRIENLLAEVPDD